MGQIITNLDINLIATGEEVRAAKELLAKLPLIVEDHNRKIGFGKNKSKVTQSACKLLQEWSSQMVETTEMITNVVE